MRKILYITPEGFDTPGPNNQMAITMIDSFLKEGFKVHLIQSKRKGINESIPEILKDRENFECDTIKRNVIDKTKFIIRYLDEVKYAFSSMKKWIRVKDCDVVFIQSCPTVVFQVILLKFLKRKPIVYNIYDVFPGHAYDIGVMNSRGLYNILKWIQIIVYKLSTIITVLSEDMKEKIKEQGVKEEKIKVVPAWYDEKVVKEVEKKDNKFIQKYNIDVNKFYIQFAGTIGYVFNYKTVLETAKLLIDYKDIEFQIIGDGNVKEKFVEEAKKMNLDNIKFYPLQPLDIVPDVYSACSICLIPLVKGVIGNGVPSKAPLLMACHRVIINSVEENSYYFKQFNENNIGISVPIGDNITLSEEILKVYNNPKLIEIMADNAKEYAKKFYTAETNVKKIIDIFNKIGEKQK